MTYQPPSRVRRARQREAQTRMEEYRRTRFNRSMQRGIKSSSSNTGGNSFLTLLALLFIGLKLTHNIDWSWWWVLAPLWIPFALLLMVALMLLMFSGLMYAGGALWNRMTRWRRS